LLQLSYLKDFEKTKTNPEKNSKLELLRKIAKDYTKIIFDVGKNENKDDEGKENEIKHDEGKENENKNDEGRFGGFFKKSKPY
jgi:hypothetical protein